MRVGDDGWFLVPNVTHADGREGIVLVVPTHTSYSATFMPKAELLRMYHLLGDELMRMRHEELQQQEMRSTTQEKHTTDNHIM